jgi:hypothetical protein
MFLVAPATSLRRPLPCMMCPHGSSDCRAGLAGDFMLAHWSRNALRILGDISGSSAIRCIARVQPLTPFPRALQRLTEGRDVATPARRNGTCRRFPAFAGCPIPRVRGLTRLGKEAIHMRRILVVIGLALLTSSSSSWGQSAANCEQIRQAVAQYGYAAARAHAMRTYGADAVRNGDKCLGRGGGRHVRHVRHHRAKRRH